MKKKTKKALIIIACILIVLAVGGYFGYNAVMEYLGDKAMNILITDQIEGMLESGEISFEEVEEIANGTPTAETQEETTPTAGKGEAIQPKPTTAPPKTQAEQKETVKEASRKITDTIPREEKQAMMKLISSRLTKADITYLAGLAAGGLEGEEISLAYKLARERFTDEEIKQVKTYWHKYKSMVLKPKPKEEAPEPDKAA